MFPRTSFGPAIRVAAVLSVVALLGACANRLAPHNELLDDVREADLGARHAERVKQAAVGRPGTGQREAQIYPGNERAARPRVAEPAAGPGVRRGADGYQLSFEGASIGDVAKVVLGDTLRLVYVIDQRVQGQITLATGRPVTRDELIKVFETALRINNAALVGDAAGYRIIPLEEAAAGAVGQVQPLRSGEPLPPGYGVTIIPLRDIASEAMLRLLDGFMARAGAVRAEAVGNMLLVRGTAREREQVAEIVETFDVSWLRGQSAGMFPLTHATPDELIQELNLLMQNEGAGLGANMLRFQPVPRLNAVLALARRAEHLQLAGTWIRRLDKSSSGGHQLYVYQVENGKAADIAQVLNETFGNGGTSRRSPRAEAAPGREVTVQSARGQTQAFNGAGQSSGANASGGANGGVPSAGPSQSSTAGSSSLSATGQPLAPHEVRIIPDDANNALLIRASQPDYQRILGALRQLDRPPLQVLINATIAEVTLNDSLRYGVQAYLKHWHDNRGAVGFNLSPNPANAISSETLTIRPSAPGFNLLAGAIGDPRLVLDALAGVTQVKIVSSPSVVVVDNQPATLKVGDEVPIATQQAQSVVSPEAPVVNTIRFRETGVILRVTPRVNSSGLVTMDVEQEISQVASAPGSTTTSLTPTISQRRIASTISVYSGQTVALGGLISEQANTDKRNVPILNRVPLVGDLIGKNEVERKRTELIVFINPRVIRNSEDASRVSEDLRSRLRSMSFEEKRHDHLGVEKKLREEWNPAVSSHTARSKN